MIPRCRRGSWRLLALLILVHTGADVFEAIPCGVAEERPLTCPNAASSDLVAPCGANDHLNSEPPLAGPHDCFCCSHSVIHAAVIRPAAPAAIGLDLSAAGVSRPHSPVRIITHPPRSL